MKKLLFLTGTLGIFTMAIAMDISFDTNRAHYMRVLPRYIERAEWNELVSWISQGWVIASDLVNHKKAAFDKRHVDNQDGFSRTLFQQLIYEIHTIAPIVTDDERFAQRHNVDIKEDTKQLKNELERLERTLEALIASDAIDHSAELAKNAISTDAPEGTAEAIYTKALNSVTTCQQNIM